MCSKYVQFSYLLNLGYEEEKEKNNNSTPNFILSIKKLKGLGKNADR